MMLTVYAERVPTNDPVWHKYGTGKQPLDVVLYDSEGNLKTRIPWHYSGKPDKRNKYQMLNCYKYRLQWIN